MVAVAFPVAGQCVVVGAFHSVCSWRWLVRRLSALESVSGLVVFGGWPVETGLCCAWSEKKLISTISNNLGLGSDPGDSGVLCAPFLASPGPAYFPAKRFMADVGPTLYSRAVLGATQSR